MVAQADMDENTPLLAAESSTRRAESSSTTEPDNVKPTAQSRAAKLRRHCQRLWWLYLLVVVVVVLCVLLLIFVYYPKKAQSEVNASSIIATHESVTNATPTSFYYNQSAVLEISTSYSPEMYAWNGSYYLEGSKYPFLSVTVPQIASHNGTIIDIQQEIQITNATEFIKSNELIFSATDFNIYLKGRGDLKLSILPAVSVNYNKKINLLGLNKLQGIEVTEFHILTSTLPDGANSAGNVSIPNPSIFELHMGNVTLDLFVNGTSIGNATLPDFTLTPGLHQYPLHVSSNQVQVLKLLKQPAYRCGLLPVEIRGKQSTVNGEEIPYFSAPLQANPLTTTLNIKPAFEEIGLGGLIGGDCS